MTHQLPLRKRTKEPAQARNERRHAMSRLDRDEIVQTAATLFAARGYTTVSVADIIDQLGCTPPRLYRRFPSKLALLHAVLAAAITRQECTGCDLTSTSLPHSKPPLTVQIW